MSFDQCIKHQKKTCDIRRQKSTLDSNVHDFRECGVNDSLKGVKGTTSGNKRHITRHVLDKSHENLKFIDY